MKKIKVFAVVLILFLNFAACNMREAEILPSERNAYSLHNTISNNHDKRKLFASLSAKEKAAVLHVRFDKFLSFSHWTPEQRAYISDLKAFVSPELYIESSYYQNEALIIESLLKERGLKLFSYEQLGKIATALDDYDFNLQNQKFNPDFPIDNVECECNLSDSWCGSRSTCVSGRCGITSSLGCGWLLSKSCNGSCY